MKNEIQNVDQNQPVKVKKDYSNLTFPVLNEGFTCANFTEAHYKLFKLASKTPTELWRLYPKSKVFHEKIIVPVTQTTKGENVAVNDPNKCYELLESYVQIPARKPPMLVLLCNAVLQDLSTLMTEEEKAKMQDVPFMNSERKA